MSLLRNLCILALALFTGQFARSQSPGDEVQWKLESVPSAWKNLPGGHYGNRNLASWFRCGVKIPGAWKSDSKLTMVVEGVDDAREVFVNGQSIGLIGTFPPEYRSGLGATMEFQVPSDLIQWDQVNVVAIRIYQLQSRGGFNVAAPVLFGSSEAIALKGQWQAAKGDNSQWAKLSARNEIPQEAIYTNTLDADAAREALKRLDNDPGPQSIASTVGQLKVPDDLQLDVPVGEPNVRQPLSIKWDASGRMWVMQYLQYPNIAGVKMVSRDKYLRTVYDKVPPAPPNHFVGADKITIHEDTDGDGIYDQHKSFIEGLNLATSFALGRGGVFVLNPPYLLFYPDRDGDDVPDGDPQVLLEGFGLEDSHSVANSLRWGPDGWLYSTQGSTVSGHIRRPDSGEEPVHSLGQLVWRYHPESSRYEIFAEGGGNSFGVEFDSEGRVYSGHNGGDTRGFHYVQGGYYRKGFGKHGALSNPHSYGYFASMTHHKVPRFTHTFVIYGGGAMPEKYDGKLFGCGPLQGHVVFSDFTPNGSSFQTKDLGYILESKDRWVRPVDVKVGPDGAIYVADMYEQRIDHASHYQGRIHRGSGRIYRLRSKLHSSHTTGNLAAMSTAQLADTLRHPSRWHRETALRLLADRSDKSALGILKPRLRDAEGLEAVNLLWAIHVSGGLDEAYALETLDHTEPLVREWTVRLLGDRSEVSQAVANRFASLALSEKALHVRSQLAATARRLNASQCMQIISALATHDEDATDIHIPLLLWWAIESKVSSEPAEVLAAFQSPDLWTHDIIRQTVLERLMRRLASSGTRVDLLACAKLLDLAPDKTHSAVLLKGFEAAFQGRSLSSLPDRLLESLARGGGGSLELRLRQKQPEALKQARQLIVKQSEKPERRIPLIRIVGDIKDDASVASLLEILKREKDASVSGAVLAALGRFESDQIAGKIIAAAKGYSDELRDVALSTLASRPNWTKELLNAVSGKGFKADQVSMNTVRKMLLHQDDGINASVEKLWGEVSGASSEAMLAEIQRILPLIGRGSGNPYNGKVLYKEHCGKCHRLFEDGGNIGPNLTAYQRDDVRRILANVVNPNLEIREGYENYVVLTLDGRAVSGFVEDQDNAVVVIKSADGERTVIEKDDIDLMRRSPNSLMPEELLSKLTDQQIRDLFAYLRASQPLP